MWFCNARGIPMAAGIAGLTTVFVMSISAVATNAADVRSGDGPTRTMIARVDRHAVPPSKVADEPYRLLILAPSVVRVEQRDGSYTITDFAQRKALVVDPAKKTAQVLEGLNPPGGLPGRSVYDLFRTIADRPIKSVPPRVIAGKEAPGFVVPNPVPGASFAGVKLPETETTAWVDPLSETPLRIDTVTREGETTTTETTTIIAFDRPLDAKLFELKPPEGYAVETFGVPALQPKLGAQANDVAPMIVMPSVGIGPVRFGMTADQTMKLLGEPDKIVSPNKDYKLLEYYSRGFSIHVTTQRGVVMVVCYTGKSFAFRVRDFAGQTDRGIKMGSGRSAIELAYGKPTSVREATMKDVFGKQANDPNKKSGQVDLTYNNVGLTFSLHDGALDSIMIRAQRPVGAVKKDAVAK